jgi:hypothetical protein
MAIKTKEEMFGDGGGFGPAVPYSTTAPGGHSAGNRGIAFGEQLTSAVANRTHYALALNDEDLDDRLGVFESDGLDAAYRLGAVASAGAGRQVTLDGGAVELISAQATIRDLDDLDALLRLEATGDSIPTSVGLDIATYASGAGGLHRRLYQGVTETSLSTSIAGTLNPGSAGATIVQASAGQFHAGGDTNLLLGMDLLQVMSGAHAGIYQIRSLGGTNAQVLVRNVDGTSPAFTADAAVTFRVFRPMWATHWYYHTGNPLQPTRATMFTGVAGARSTVDISAARASSATAEGASTALRVLHKLMDGTQEVRALFDYYGALVLTHDPDAILVGDQDEYSTGLRPATIANLDNSLSVEARMTHAVRGTGGQYRYDYSSQSPLITPNKDYTTSPSTVTFNVSSATGTIFIAAGEFTGADTSDVLPIGCLVRISGAASGNGLYVLAERIADNEFTLMQLDGDTAVFPTVGSASAQFYLHQAIGYLPPLATLLTDGPSPVQASASAHFQAPGVTGGTALFLTAPRIIGANVRHLIRAAVGEADITNAGLEVFSVNTEGVVEGSVFTTRRRGSALSPVDPITGFTGLTLIAENIQDGGNQRIRTYVSPEGMIWETINAAWDGSDWSYDVLGTSVAILRGTVTTQRAAIQLLFHSGVGTWATTDWDRTMNLHQDYLELIGPNTGSSFINPEEPVASTSATIARTLYPSAVVKTWGRLAIAGGPAVSVGTGMNISAVSLISADAVIQVDLATPFSSVNDFAPFASINSASPGRTVQPEIVSASRVYLRKFNGTSAEAYDSGDNVFFQALGHQ